MPKGAGVGSGDVWAAPCCGVVFPASLGPASSPCPLLLGWVINRPAISDGWHVIEVEWLAASAVGANDGRFALWIDDILKDELTGMDFTPLDTVRLGAVDKVDATTQGVYYFDAFESRRDGYIGPLVANGGTNSVVAAADGVLTSAPLPTSTPGGGARPLKKTNGRTHMAKPVTALTAEQMVTNTTNSETAQTGGETVIQRVTYSLTGQPIAVRVTGDPDPTNNGLFYLHSDHLGSTTALSDASGQLAGEVTRYYPFGEYRTGGQSAITDRGFTGHKENRSLGLTYMNARYYVVGIGRFASADTIVPDPTSPQSLNRYTYGDNSPLNYVDPTGHYSTNTNGASENCYDLYTCQYSYTPSSEDAVYPEGFEYAGYLVGHQPIDAHAVGSTTSVSVGLPLVSGNAVVGGETVINPNSKEVTRFWVVGYGISAGLIDTGVMDPENLEALVAEEGHPYPKLSLASSVYYGAIRNIEENWDYRGEFEATTVTAAHGLGVVGGRARTPGDDELERAYSENIGLAIGEGFSIDASNVWYIPTITYNWEQRRFSIPFIPYILEAE